MEFLSCDKCDAIVMLYDRKRVIAMPHHRYRVLGAKCGACGHFEFVKRYSWEYRLKETT